MPSNVIVKLCNAYGVSADWLLGRDKEMKVSPNYLLAGIKKTFAEMKDQLSHVESVLNHQAWKETDLESGD
jgi:hypothetical protein